MYLSFNDKVMKTREKQTISVLSITGRRVKCNYGNERQIVYLMRKNIGIELDEIKNRKSFVFI